MNRGPLFEAFNWAKLFNLPVLFIAFVCLNPTPKLNDEAECVPVVCTLRFLIVADILMG